MSQIPLNPPQDLVAALMRAVAAIPESHIEQPSAPRDQEEHDLDQTLRALRAWQEDPAAVAMEAVSEGNLREENIILQHELRARNSQIDALSLERFETRNDTKKALDKAHAESRRWQEAFIAHTTAPNPNERHDLAAQLYRDTLGTCLAAELPKLAKEAVEAADALLAALEEKHALEYPIKEA